MRAIPLFLFIWCLLCSCTEVALPKQNAQGARARRDNTWAPQCQVVRTPTASPSPPDSSKANERATKAVAAKITREPWTWELDSQLEGELTFFADGRAVFHSTGRQEDYIWSWSLFEAQTIQVTTNEKTKTFLRFDSDFTSFSGLNHEGKQLHGHLEKGT